MRDNKLFYAYLFVAMTISDIGTMPATPNNCSRRSANEDKQIIQPLNEMILASDNLQRDALNTDLDETGSFRKSYGGLLPLPIILNDDALKSFDNQKAFACSQMQCNPEETEPIRPVCACNYNTGHVVTFKSECDAKKHNCRFDTDFHVILNEICPWEFQSRRGSSVPVINYDDPKYYN